MPDPLKATCALALCAHPDDETLGVGGILAALADRVCHVHVAIYTQGGQGYADLAERDRIQAIRAEEVKAALEVLGVPSHEFLGFEDMAVPRTRDALHRTIEIIRRTRPDVIFAHHEGDIHPDHQAVAALAVQAWFFAYRPLALELGEPWRAQALFHFEVLHPFTPTHIVDITAQYDRVREAFRCYTSQHAVIPHTFQHLDALTALRGAAIGAPRGQALIQSFRMPQRLDIEL